MGFRFTSRSKKPAEHKSSPSLGKTGRSFAPLHPVFQLQRTIGNQGVLHLLESQRIQPQCTCGGTCPRCQLANLKISQPGDKFEQEADRVADQVMRMPDSQVQCRELRQYLQSGGSTLGPDLASRIRSLEGGGRPLPAFARGFFESRFNRDFSRVRVHTGAAAADTAAAVNARAFAHGYDVVFAPGEFRPETGSGQTLLAHELTHVVQQTGEPVRPAAEAKNRERGNPGTMLKHDAITRTHQPTLARWQPLGVEQYTACTDPPYFWPQVCNNNENRRLAPLEVRAGTETEWRQTLSSGGYAAQKAKRLFLRAVYVSAGDYPAYAVRRQNWQLLIDFVYGEHDLQAERQLSRVPDDDEKMAFAKALFLRGGQQLAPWEHESALLAEFVRDYQHRVVEGEARAGRTFSREQAGLVIPADPRGTLFNPASELVGLSMLSNGAALLMRGLAQYIHNFGRNLEERQNANRIIQAAGNIMRQSAEDVDRINAEERRNFERAINLVVDAFALPGASTASRLIRNSFKATVTPAIGGAFFNTREATQRMLAIQTGTIVFLEGYNYQEAGHEPRAGQDLKESLQTMVRSLLQ